MTICTILFSHIRLIGCQIILMVCRTGKRELKEKVQSTYFGVPGSTTEQQYCTKIGKILVVVEVLDAYGRSTGNIIFRSIFDVPLQSCRILRYTYRVCRFIEGFRVTICTILFSHIRLIGGQIILMVCRTGKRELEEKVQSTYFGVPGSTTEQQYCTKIGKILVVVEVLDAYGGSTGNIIFRSIFDVPLQSCRILLYISTLLHINLFISTCVQDSERYLYRILKKNLNC